MRVGIIVEESIKGKCAFTAEKYAKYRGVEIFIARLSLSGRERRIRRMLKRLAREITRLGITFCAVSSRFPYCDILGKCGIYVVTERSLMRKLRAELALSFAEKIGASADFMLVGGSASAVYETARILLSRRRRLFISCPCAETVSERIFEETGVRLGEFREGAIIKILMGDEHTLIVSGNRRAAFSDFLLTIADAEFPEISPYEASALVSALEICGILRKNEVKTVCLFEEKL